jgi:DNA primase
MPGRISDDAIRTIRERASLIEVVSDVVALRRRGGRSALGLCPFHAEKTPSFNVSEEHGFYHCFGCDEHGDVFSFVMKTQSLSFPDAVRTVAQRFGLPVPEEASAGSGARTEPLVLVSETAAAFFRGALRGPDGARARDYLAQRGIRPDTIERFGLGYAPGGGDALARHLRAQALSLDDAVGAGLVMRRTAGGVLDRFRDRLIFPIADLRGRVVAFGGRVLPGAPSTGDPPPKYLNSPESPIFHKGRSLYGLTLARDAIRERGRVAVVEGYLDVISVAQAGIGEVVAPLGTALTVDQLGIVSRFTERVIACFDGDAAGRRAAARSFPTFIDAGLWGRGVFLPAGDDPDTFVRAHDGAAFGALLDTAEPLIEAWLADVVGPDRDAVRRRAEAAREVARLLQRLRSRDPDKFDVLAGRAAQTIGVAEERLRAEGVAVRAPAPAPAAPRAVGPAEEELIVELLAAHPEIGDRVRQAGIVADFEHQGSRAAAEQLLAETSGDRTSLVQSLPRELRDRVARRLLDESDEQERDRALADCIARIQDRRLRRVRGRLRDELRAAEARGDLPAADRAKRMLHEQLTEKPRT